VPVVIMTGWEMRNSEVNPEDKRVDLLVSKPFKIDEVLRAVKEGLELKDRTD